MENRVWFQDYAIVACGTVNLELNYLKNRRFLAAREILYTKPGRHEVPRELEGQLLVTKGERRCSLPGISELVKQTVEALGNFTNYWLSR